MKEAATDGGPSKDGIPSIDDPKFVSPEEASEVDDDAVVLGVSGMLVNNNLIMYDRELERWWPQIGAVSIPGEWHDTDGGATLREFEVVRTTFEQWRNSYPETVVLSSETGFARNYQRDPYENRGYYQNDNTIFGNIYENDHLHAKEWVYGGRTEEGAVAVTRERLHSEGIVDTELGGVCPRPRPRYGVVVPKSSGCGVHPRWCGDHGY